MLAIASLTFWPAGGWVRRWQSVRRMTRRALTEDALKHIQKMQNRGRQATLESVAGSLEISGNRAAFLLSEMERNELVIRNGEGYLLTQTGAEAALHVIRAHRLWERYLSEETGYQEAEWHIQAERREHALTPEQADALSARLGNPTHDPHGDPIPSSEGTFVPHQGQPLTTYHPGERLLVVHLEDEPEAVYAQISAEGLYPGMEVQLIETSPQRVRFWANGDEHLLAPIVAANISVIQLPEVVEHTRDAETLDTLRGKEMGEVVRILPRCRGQERHRLIDLGILPGTRVTAELVSPLGDPTAYRVRGALIALRKEQAQSIQIRKVGEA